MDKIGGYIPKGYKAVIQIKRNPMNTLKELSIMDLKEKKGRYKNVPDYALPKSKFSDSNANGLTQSILKYLTLKGHFATRTSSSGRYLVNQKKWIPSTTKKGYPDITGIVYGKSIHIEVKVGKDKMSADQLRVKDEIEKAGGLYFIAKDFDSFVKWYNLNFEQ